MKKILINLSPLLSLKTLTFLVSQDFNLKHKTWHKIVAINKKHVSSNQFFKGLKIKKCPLLHSTEWSLNWTHKVCLFSAWVSQFATFEFKKQIENEISRGCSFGLQPCNTSLTQMARDLPPLLTCVSCLFSCVCILSGFKPLAAKNWIRFFN